jgi:hypothetical protein
VFNKAPELLMKLATEAHSWEAVAVQNFRNIVIWMGDRPAQECQRIASAWTFLIRITLAVYVDL